jgi:hypothetical protein
VLVAAGIAAIPNPVLYGVALGAAGLLSLRGVGSCYGCLTTVQDWRSATAYVLAHGQPADGIYLDPPYLKIPFSYYPGHTTAVPRSQFPVVSPQLDQTTRAPSRARYPRVWLFVDWADPQERRYRYIPFGIRRTYREITRKRFAARIDVTLFQVRNDSGPP